jgi:hypothetical protein
MVRKVVGVSAAIERLRLSHVPQNTPVTSADSKMLMHCQIASASKDRIVFLSSLPTEKAALLRSTDRICPPYHSDSLSHSAISGALNATIKAVSQENAPAKHSNI